MTKVPPWMKFRELIQSFYQCTGCGEKFLFWWSHPSKHGCLPTMPSILNRVIREVQIGVPVYFLGIKMPWRKWATLQDMSDIKGCSFCAGCNQQAERIWMGRISTYMSKVIGSVALCISCIRYLVRAVGMQHLNW